MGTYAFDIGEADDPENGLQRVDLHRDVSPVLTALVGHGHRVGVAANEAGLTSVLVRRGPWGVVHAARPEASAADRVIDSLDEPL